VYLFYCSFEGLALRNAAQVLLAPEHTLGGCVRAPIVGSLNFQVWAGKEPKDQPESVDVGN
jgi:hypothetical protein